jgi:hypothetical protein
VTVGRFSGPVRRRRAGGSTESIWAPARVYKTINSGGDPRMTIAADGTIIVTDQTGSLRFIY